MQTRNKSYLGGEMESNLHIQAALKMKSVESIENPRSRLESAQAADVMDRSVRVMTQCIWGDTDWVLLRKA